MAYIIDKYEDISSGDTKSIKVTLPDDYSSNDLLIVFVSQDNGSTAFSIDNTDWTELFQRKSDDGTRLGVYYRIADSDNVASFTVTGYDSADWSVISISVRDVNTDSPIDTHNEKDHKGDKYVTAPDLTLNYDNELILYGLENDTSKFNWGVIAESRFVGKSRSLGTCLSVFMRWSETKSDYYNATGLKEDENQGGNYTAVAIRSSSEATDYKEYNPVDGDEVVELFGYTSTTTFDTTDKFADTILDISTDSTALDISHTKISIAPWGYSTVADNTNDAPTDDRWQGIVHNFDNETDFTNGNGDGSIISMFLAENSTYYKKLDKKGIIFGLKDSNANWIVYNIPTKDLGGYIPSSLIIDLDNVYPDDTSDNAIDLTKVKSLILAHHRSPSTDQEAKIYFKYLTKFNSYGVTGGSTKLPITSDKIIKDLLGWEFYDIAEDMANTCVLSTSLTIDDTNETYVDLSKKLITPNSKKYIKLGDYSINYNFTLYNQFDFSKVLLNSANLSYMYVDNNDDMDPNNIIFDGTSIIDFEIDFELTKDLTISNLTIMNSILHLSTNSITINKTNYVDTQVLCKSLSQMTNSNFKAVNKGSDYAVVISDTGTMELRCSFDGYTTDLHFTATSGDITVNRHNFPEPTYKSEGVNVTFQNLVDVKVTVKDIKNNDTISGARVYIHDDTNNKVLINDVTDSNGELVYQYDYTSDIDITGKVRMASDGKLYKPFKFTGTITKNGFEITVLMIEDY